MRRRVDTRSLLPRYAQARQYLEDLIRCVPYGPGDQLPSERELAATFHVSQMTMNRAIQEMVRDGVLYREIGRGTFVMEQEGRPARNGTLALVTLFSEGHVKRDPYASEILRGAQQAAARFGRDLLLIQEPLYNPEGIEPRLEERAAGLLVVSPPDEALPALRRLRADTVPFLAVGSSWLDEDIPAIDSDNILGARQATEHILSFGHERIGYIGAPEDLSNSRDRHTGFRRTLEAAGRSYRPEWVVMCESASRLAADKRAELVRIARKPGGPTAFLAAGYELAVSGIEALQSAGLDVPGDISVVGFDDTFSAAFLNPPLTTVVQPLGAMGERAVERLHAMLIARDRGEPVPETPIVERLPTHLVVRQSCAPPPNAR